MQKYLLRCKVERYESMPFWVFPVTSSNTLDGGVGVLERIKVG